MASKRTKRATRGSRKPKVETPIQIDGVDGWSFLVYDDDSYTLISPKGTSVPPMDHLGAERIAELRKGAN